MVDIPAGNAPGRRRGQVRLSLPRSHCKLSASLPTCVSGLLRSRCAFTPPACLAWIVLTGCTAGMLPPARIVRLADLECSPARTPTEPRRCFVREPDALQSLVHPLGRRLGLLEVTSAEQWRELAQAVPGIGSSPDLTHGIVVGLVSVSGTPVDGGPPFRLQAIRVHDGAGLVQAQFNSGTYLPDGSAYLEMTYVNGLRSVLVVNVNGVDYVAEEPARKTVVSRSSLIH